MKSKECTKLSFGLRICANNDAISSNLLIVLHGIDQFDSPEITLS